MGLGWWWLLRTDGLCLTQVASCVWYSAFCGVLDRFAKAVANVKHAAHVSLSTNETSAVMAWHVPEAHFLEAWGDARAYDGTASLVQPLIEPLFGGKSHQPPVDQGRELIGNEHGAGTAERPKIEDEVFRFDVDQGCVKGQLAPVAQSNCDPCHGHWTIPQIITPSASGPPLCVHRSSNPTNPSSVRPTTMRRSPRCTSVI